jgi:hypothetical protein
LGNFASSLLNATHARGALGFFAERPKCLGIKGRLSSTFKVLQIIRQHKKSQNAQTFEHQGFSRDAQFFWAAMSPFNLKKSSEEV